MLTKGNAGRQSLTSLNLSAKYYQFQYWIDSVCHKGNHIIPPILIGDKNVVELEIELLYPPQNGVLGGYTVFSLSVLPSFRLSVIPSTFEHFTL